MLVLALDTTTRAGSIALARDGEVLAVTEGDATKPHAERLPEALVRVLRDRGLDVPAVDVFAVAAGPGSFTGLRIGIATIQGLAFALGRPVVAVSVLDALAQVGAHEAGLKPRAFDELVAAWMDAQRSEVFAALYRRSSGVPGSGAGTSWEPVALDLVDGPVSEPPAHVLDRWETIAPTETIRFSGDGVARYRDLIVDRLAARVRTVEPLPPLAPTIARIAALEAAAGNAVAPHAVRPIYVRRSDAELARDRKR